MCNAIEMLKPKIPERSIEKRFKDIWKSLETTSDKARALGNLCRCAARNEEALDEITPYGLAALFDDIADGLHNVQDVLLNLEDRIKKKASSEQPETDTEEA